jgi:hypothetical protein
MLGRPRRALAWLPLLVVPLLALAASGLGCELLVNVDSMLVEGGADVLVPMSLDGYDCPICKDVSPDAVFDGPDFPEAGRAESGTARDSGAESSKADARTRDGEADVRDGETDVPEE